MEQELYEYFFDRPKYGYAEDYEDSHPLERNLEDDYPDFEEDYQEEAFVDDCYEDADVYRSIGWGTDEDYGYFGYEE